METMILLHESDGRAFTLGPAVHERHLKVVDGRAWITCTQRRAGPLPPEDLWLAPGEQLALPAGSAWVVEAAGPLRLRLCEPGLSAAVSGGAASWVSAVARLARAWQTVRPRRRLAH